MKSLTDYINEQVNEGLFGFGKIKHGDFMKSLAHAMSALNGAFYDIKKAAAGFDPQVDVTFNIGYVVNGEQKYGNMLSAEWNTQSDQPKLLLKYSGKNAEERNVPVVLCNKPDEEYNKEEKHKVLAILSNVFRKAADEAIKAVSEYRKDVNENLPDNAFKIKKACDLYVGFLDELADGLRSKPDSWLEFGDAEKTNRDKAKKLLEKYAQKNK